MMKFLAGVGLFGGWFLLDYLQVPNCQDLKLAIFGALVHLGIVTIKNPQDSFRNE